MGYYFEKKKGKISLKTGKSAISLVPSDDLSKKIKQGKAILIAGVHTHPWNQHFSWEDAKYTFEQDDYDWLGLPLYLIIPSDESGSRGLAYRLDAETKNNFDELDKLPMTIVQYDESLVDDVYK